METTVMPAAASVQKQQGLNQVVINKVQRMIEGRQGLWCGDRTAGYR